MPMPRRALLLPPLLLTLCLGAGLPAPVQAAAGSADEAAAQARQQTGGRVLRVREQGQSYEVKVLTPDGAVRNVRIPARRER